MFVFILSQNLINFRFFSYFMKNENHLSWDTYFMSVAVLSSFRSKDKKTQTGACIVNSNKRIVGVGYNGLPKGLDDNNSQFWNDDDNDVLNSKHTFVIHAEQNAIHNRISQSLENSTLYVTLFPCKECTKSICQVGIKKVIYLFKKPHHEEENEAVNIMLKSAGIEIVTFSDLKLKDKDFINNLIEIYTK